jgi:two-component system, cell cycle sensor histidine kinase and response regulator CckA
MAALAKVLDRELPESNRGQTVALDSRTGRSPATSSRPRTCCPNPELRTPNHRTTEPRDNAGPTFAARAQGTYTVAGRTLTWRGALLMISNNADIDSANTVVVALAPDRRIIRWNREAERVFGWTRDEAVGRDAHECLGADIRFDDAIARVLAGAAPWSFELRGEARDGSSRVALWTFIPSSTAAGHAAEILAVAHDITHRARAEERARAGEADLREAQRVACLGSWIWQIEPDVVTWSDEMFRIAGRDPRLGAPSYADQATLYDPPDVLARAVERARLTGEPFEVEVSIVRPSGGRRWTVARGTAERDGNGTIVRMRGTVQDLTERHEQQAMLQAVNDSLQRSEHRYRDLVENLLDVVFSLDVDGRLEYVSPAISKYGYVADDVIGTHFSLLFHPGDLAAIESAFAATLAGDNDPAEYRALDTSGGIHHVQISARAVFDDDRPAGLTGVVIDVTEQRQAEERLRVSQRLEAVGRLAGGVAHDFNNLLVVIIGYAEFAMDSVREGDPIRGDLEEIRKAGERAAALTRQLLAFSRRQLLKPEVISLNEVVRGMDGMLGRLIGEDIEFKTVLTDDLAPVLADPGQIEQVLMNLVVNARDAMPTGGTLTIATAPGRPRDAQIGRAAERGDEWVVLSVADTGSGMDDATRAQIFEPFFTTKPQGEGTGLGLATVYGIVNQSGGTIALDTAPGAGTTFRVALPADRSGAPVANLPGSRAQASPRPGKETILIAEDEDAVRQLAQRFLAAAGYQVLTAANGDSALRIAEQHGGPIDLLLADVVMPLMSGPELAQRLDEARPGLRVLFISGYTGTAISKHGVLGPETRLLEKPFTGADLLKRVRQILDESRGARSH